MTLDNNGKITWVTDHIIVAPPKHPKKITGTRFGAILGANKWSSPFKTWCEITRTYEEPFEDTIYTIAGKTIEPKQAEYMRRSYAMYGLKTPEDIYGKDYFKRTHGDFFKKHLIMGGMWDYLLYDNDRPVAVLEMKTTKRAEDWKTDIPEYYALQAALYAHLLDVNQVYIVASFLDPSDYDEPDNFVPSINNTVVIPFKVSERYPNFDALIERAEKWWREHVETGVSPAFDEKRDAEVLKALRAKALIPDGDLAALLNEADVLSDKVTRHFDAVDAEVKRLEELQSRIKDYQIERFGEHDRSVSLASGKREWTTCKVTSVRFDTKSFADENPALYGKYLKPITSYKFTVKEKKHA